MSRIQVMCKPRNAQERKLLIDAGIITASQKHPWVFLEQLRFSDWVNGAYTSMPYWNVYTHYGYRTESLRVTVKQFINIYNFISLIPEADITHIVPFVESTSRNRAALKHYYRVADLINVK